MIPHVTSTQKSTFTEMQLLNLLNSEHRELQTKLTPKYSLLNFRNYLNAIAKSSKHLQQFDEA
jgi:hypothetical protein